MHSEVVQHDQMLDSWEYDQALPPEIVEEILQEIRQEEIDNEPE